jgi:hypothetical protein
MTREELEQASADALRQADAYERAGRSALARSIRAAVEAERREVGARDEAAASGAAEAVEPAEEAFWLPVPPPARDPVGAERVARSIRAAAGAAEPVDWAGALEEALYGDDEDDDDEG